MKNASQSLFAGMILLAGLTLTPAHAAPAQAGLPLGTIRTIQDNAQAARDNAGIYQWRRVTLEVERIVAAERSLEQALPKGNAPAPATALRQAVLELRSARFDHDVKRTQAAAAQVSAQCALLLG